MAVGAAAGGHQRAHQLGSAWPNAQLLKGTALEGSQSALTIGSSQVENLLVQSKGRFGATLLKSTNLLNSETAARMNVISDLITLCGLPEAISSLLSAARHNKFNRHTHGNDVHCPSTLEQRRRTLSAVPKLIPDLQNNTAAYNSNRSLFVVRAQKLFPLPGL